MQPHSTLAGRSRCPSPPVAHLALALLAVAPALAGPRAPGTGAADPAPIASPVASPIVAADPAGLDADPRAPRPQGPDDVRPDRDLLNLSRSGLALDGWDPVAYFPEGGGEPRRGDRDRAVVHRGVTYRFASDANRDRFLADPERYEPAYGGWCAYAMASDDRVGIDPETFLIQDGELLLFYNAFFTNTKKKWTREGAAELRREADRHWHTYHPTPERDLSGWVLEDGLALGGHDPVRLCAKASALVPGSAQRTWTYKGVTYRFADEGSRTTFRARPWAYEPRLGGQDPRSVVAGEPRPGVLEQRVVHDGALWLFVDAASREAFLADPAAVLEALRRP